MRILLKKILKKRHQKFASPDPRRAADLQPHALPPRQTRSAAHPPPVLLPAALRVRLPLKTLYQRFCQNLTEKYCMLHCMPSQDLSQRANGVHTVLQELIDIIWNTAASHCVLGTVLYIPRAQWVDLPKNFTSVWKFVSQFPTRRCNLAGTARCIQHQGRGCMETCTRCKFSTEAAILVRVACDSHIQGAVYLCAAGMPARCSHGGRGRCGRLPEVLTRGAGAAGVPPSTSSARRTSRAALPACRFPPNP